MHIMTNPNRSRGAHANGSANSHLQQTNGAAKPQTALTPHPKSPVHVGRGGPSMRGGFGRGGFQSSPRGGYGPTYDRGRGVRGGYRGRGRGDFIAQPLSS
jgi:5'-3' exoribonuclease 1